MLQTHLQNGFHMIVRQGIQDIFPLPAEFDELHLLQNPKLVGNGALGQRHLIGNVRHAQLLHRQQRQDMHPGTVREALEQLRDIVQGLFVGNRLHPGTPPWFFFEMHID